MNNVPEQGDCIREQAVAEADSAVRAAGERLAWRHAVHPDAVGPQLLRQSLREGHQRSLADGVPARAAPAQAAAGRAGAPQHSP